VREDGPTCPAIGHEERGWAHDSSGDVPRA
jgi:hypothetical protein